jgi:hypothetical protein
MDRDRLTWTDHALAEMRFRGITKTDVRVALAKPEIDVPSPASIYRREVTGSTGHLRRRITVIILPFKTTTRVITVYPTKQSVS